MITAQNYLSQYENAVGALSNGDDDIQAMHRAVLALARAGSLQFALKEYTRYGLDNIRHHEDIQALGGRLLKDLALVSSGNTKTEYARQSSEKYEQAFQDTGGYYSGINAATMALIAGVPQDIVRARADAVLNTLPAVKNLDPSSKFFIEATRAESNLILGNEERAETDLFSAVRHDPQNYIAHASTLKQFRMILDYLNKPVDWLNVFNPPTSIHFAGHIFGLGHKKNQLNPDQYQALKTAVSDAIQSQDLGFGYGALAAGSDIVIAETLLEEGAELHVVLPCAPEQFCEISVKPFGKKWVPRFDKLMQNAHSRQIIGTGDGPFQARARLSSAVAMGMATMHASTLDAPHAQLLIWDEKTTALSIGTASDARVWSKAGHKNIIIPYPGTRSPNQAQSSPNDDAIMSYVNVHVSDENKHTKQILKDAGYKAVGNGDYTMVFDHIEKGVASLSELSESLPPSSKFAIDANIGRVNDENDKGAANIHHALPGAIYAGQTAAAILHAFHGAEYHVDYAGISKRDEQPQRLFKVARKL